MMTLEQLGVGRRAWVERVGGPRAFRRRIMELGLLPGTAVEVVRVAPLKDPIELRVRGCNLSIRAAQARDVWVRLQVQPLAVEVSGAATEHEAELSSVAAQ